MTIVLRFGVDDLITNDKGEALFPNATVRAVKADPDFWLDNETFNRLPKDQAPFVQLPHPGATIELDIFPDLIIASPQTSSG